jgi:hypothetical protein
VIETRSGARPQGLPNELIESAPVAEEKVGRIRRRPRLGGLLNYYDRAA